MKPDKGTVRHTTMKCGYICLDCRNVEFRLKDLESRSCCGKLLHRKVLRAGYMCQNCPAVSDDIAAFQREVCPQTFERPQVPSPASPDSPTEPGRLSIKGRKGRIGGYFMDVPVVLPCVDVVEAARPTESLSKEAPDTVPKEAAKEDAPAPVLTTPSPKPTMKRTWTDLPSPDSLPTRKFTNPEQPTLVLPIPARAPSDVSSTTLLEESDSEPRPLQESIQRAQRELEKLLLLQELDRERQQLEKLVMAKNAVPRS